MALGLGSRLDTRVAKRSPAPHIHEMPWAICLMIGAALFRCLRPWVGGPDNFAPLAALALCGGLYFPRPWNWAGPLLALLLSDAVLNLHYGLGVWTGSTLVAGLAYVGIASMGVWLARRPSWLAWGAGSLLASTFFYVVSNTEAWWSLPAYSKSWAGWLQALTVGLPGYPPTWMFFRHSVISDFIFTFLLVVGFEWSARRFPQGLSASRSILPWRPAR